MTRAYVSPMGVIMSVAKDDPYRGLLAATLRIAVVDAQAGDTDALRWLASDTAAALIAYLVPHTSKMDAADFQRELLARLPPRKAA